MLHRTFLLWLPMIVIAFANATIRQLVFIKHTSELRAHQLSTITLILLNSVYVWFIFSIIQVTNIAQAFMAGMLWVVLTVFFELIFGFLTGRSIGYLLQDYQVQKGRMWPFFLAWLFLLPFLNLIIRR